MPLADGTGDKSNPNSRGEANPSPRPVFQPSAHVVREYSSVVGDELGPEFAEKAFDLISFLLKLGRKQYEINVIIEHWKGKEKRGQSIASAKSYYHPSGKAFAPVIAKALGDTEENVSNKNKAEDLEFIKVAKIHTSGVTAQPPEDDPW